MTKTNIAASLLPSSSLSPSPSLSPLFPPPFPIPSSASFFHFPFLLPPPHLSLQTEISRRLFGEGKEELVEGQLHQTNKLEARKQVNRDPSAQTECRHVGPVPTKDLSCIVQPRGWRPQRSVNIAYSFGHPRLINVKHELVQPSVTPPRPFTIIFAQCKPSKTGKGRLHDSIES